MRHYSDSTNSRHAEDVPFLASWRPCTESTKLLPVVLFILQQTRTQHPTALKRNGPSLYSRTQSPVTSTLPVSSTSSSISFAVDLKKKPTFRPKQMAVIKACFFFSSYSPLLLPPSFQLHLSFSDHRPQLPSMY